MGEECGGIRWDTVVGRLVEATEDVRGQGSRRHLRFAMLPRQGHVVGGESQLGSHRVGHMSRRASTSNCSASGGPAHRRDCSLDEVDTCHASKRAAEGSHRPWASLTKWRTRTNSPNAGYRRRTLPGTLLSLSNHQAQLADSHTPLSFLILSARAIGRHRARAQEEHPLRQAPIRPQGLRTSTFPTLRFLLMPLLHVYHCSSFSFSPTQ